jgi:mRNA-degrading endonuclease RelE of RelBE toxin-antitoxin system
VKVSDDIVSFEIDYHKEFENNVEELVKKKKFRNLPKQVAELTEKLKAGELDGDKITSVEKPVKYDVYKLRLPNKDTNEGKSNGYRVVYMAMTDKREVLLLTVYYKKEKTNVSDNFVRGLIEGYLLAQNDVDK